jgi:hypothetical protein
MAGMPQFPVKPLLRHANLAHCSIQPASCTTAEPKSDPYSDFSDHHQRVVAMTLSGSGSKRAIQPVCSQRDIEATLVRPTVFTADGIHFLQLFLPADPSGFQLGVVRRC